MSQPSVRPYATRFLWEPGDLELVEDGGAPDTLSEHQSGSHDQRTHGRRGLGGALTGAAVDHYGVTDNIHEAGYLTPDGRFLDFSGRHEAVGYVRDGDRWVPESGQPDYLANQRSIDHRDAHVLFPDKNLGNAYETHDQAIYEMLDGGFVRVSAHVSSGEMFFEVSKNLNPGQFSVLARAAKDAQNVTVEKSKFNWASLAQTQVGYASNFNRPGLSNAAVLRQFTDISEALAEAILAEHQSGSHDQRAHGRRGVGSGYAATLAAVEDEIRQRSDGETLVAVSLDGDVIFRKEFEGDPDGPGPAIAGGSLSRAEFEPLEGSTIVHNHPDGGLGPNGFSQADVMAAVVSKPAEIRVVTKGGTTYSLKPAPGETFDRDAQFSTLMVVEQAFGRNLQGLRDKFQAGEITPSVGNWAMSHLSVASLAKTFGWVYEVTGPGANGPE